MRESPSATVPAAFEDLAWMARARPAAGLLCDAFFRVAESIEIGPDGGQAARPEHRIPLPAPELPREEPGKAATAELLGREGVFAAHCAGLLDIAAAHGRPDLLAQPFPYFRVSPALRSRDGVLASWPWSDTLPGAAMVLEALARADRVATRTLLWDDEDQGWHLRIIAAAGRAYIVEWDAEGPPPRDEAWQVDAAELAGQAAAALGRLRTVHERLVAALGRDVWSGPGLPAWRRGMLGRWRGG